MDKTNEQILDEEYKAYLQRLGHVPTSDLPPPKFPKNYREPVLKAMQRVRAQSVTTPIGQIHQRISKRKPRY